MLQLVYTNTFDKELKLAVKRGKKIDKLKTILELLVSNKALPVKNRDHQLMGTYKGRRECHIEPDWLLIYKKTADTITLERTGSHADLFK